jgi:predicted secreted Zn-dependent protease
MHRTGEKSVMRNVGGEMKHLPWISIFLLVLTAKVFSQDTDKAPTITSDIARSPNTTIVTYEITGSTESEMREQMNRLRPKSEHDSADYDARTEWTYEWGWPGRGTTACDLSKAFVLYHITVTLPHWTPPDDAPEALVEKWEKYMQALIAHEKGHVDNVVAHYMAIVSAIKNADCYTAEENAKAILEQIRREEEFYDAVTSHGMKRGAVFP